MITPEQLYAMRDDKKLPIGDAWNALGEAAERIEELEAYIWKIETENMEVRQDTQECLEYVCIGDGNPHRANTIERFQVARKNMEQGD